MAERSAPAGLADAAEGGSAMAAGGRRRRVRRRRIGFPPAAQPEIMRAAEKDEQYVTQVCEACNDAFRHLLGTRLAVAYQNETRLAGRVLYYLLTTGSGQQTLGEEYCDISQVAGSNGLPPTPARRILFVVFQTVLPYVGHRLSTRAAVRGLSLASQSPEDDVHDGNLDPTAGSRDRDSHAGRHVALGQEDGHVGRAGNDLRQVSSSSAEVTVSRASEVMQRVQRAWLTALQYWPVVLPSVREALLLIVRTHLMFFYFEGAYYHLAKRAAGIRYIFMGRPTQQRPRYYMLGLFLLIQLTILGGDWLRRSIIPALANSMHLHSQDPPLSTAGHRGIAMLDEDGKNAEDEASQRSMPSSTGDAEVSASSKCTLCLSPRQHPTATPCGHVFCWKCIVGWCNEKPECPLCRAPTSHRNLVCIYRADF